MPRYVAFLRGVTPMNAKMAELKRCFEEAGFTAVRTVLASGNVVFDARSGSAQAVERRVEAAMTDGLARPFAAIVRSVRELETLLASDPFAGYRLPAGAKRVVTFLRERPSKKIALPIEFDGARILSLRDREAFTAYVAGQRGPSFMKLIEQTLGKDVTTRSWDTVRKCAAA